MFHPLPVFVGLRYARARTHKFFVSFITWVSLLGVAVGVATLIVILSVMNGLESELRERLLTLTAAVSVQAQPDTEVDWQRLRGEVAAMPGAGRVTRFAQLQALAVNPPEMLPVLLRGTDLAESPGVARLVVDADPGHELLEPGGVILGVGVADQLGVAPGGMVRLMVPSATAGAVPQAALREFHVTALFEAGIQDHDSQLVFASLPTLAALGAARAGSEGLELQVADALQAPAVAAAVRDALARAGHEGLVVRDWTQDHGSYFRAIRIEKTMMALILLLVVAVAAFNIVAMLVMVVTDKRTDIAILRTLGASPLRVAGIFITQGLVVGGAGVALGVALGVWLALHVDEVLALLERLFGLQVFDASIYVITSVPSELHGYDVGLIALGALALAALATIYPARRAAAVPPAEALRYE